jgi:hypothetical protein
MVQGWLRDGKKMDNKFTLLLTLVSYLNNNHQQKNYFTA